MIDEGVKDRVKANLLNLCIIDIVECVQLSDRMKQNKMPTCK